jgi:PAS domain S-box-containing protein
MNTNELSDHLVDPARLAALRAVVLLDTPAEESFDRLTWLAAHCLHAPIALVSLIDHNRQFFKSCLGLPEPWSKKREAPLSHSFCQHNRLSGQALLIEDARTHPLIKDNPAIRDLNFISYLGFPLVTPDGYVLGAFCVIDTKPRHWTPDDVNVIQNLTHSVMTEIQLRTEIATHANTRGKQDNVTKLQTNLHGGTSTRFQAEEALEITGTEDKLKSTLQITNDILPYIPFGMLIYQYVTPDKLYLKSCNPEAEKITGRREADLQGKTFAESWPGTEDASLTTAFLEVMWTGNIYKNEEYCYQDDQLEGFLRICAFRLPNDLLAISFEDVSERKRRTKALADSDATLRSICESSPILMGVVELTENDKIFHLYDNPATARFFNVQYQGTKHKTADELGAPSNAIKEWLEAYRKSQLKGNPVRFEYLHNSPDGSQWLSATVSTIGPGLQGRTRFSYVAEDITEQKQAEAALHASEERLRQAVRVGDIGIFDHDHITNTYYWSAELRQNFGLNNQSEFTEVIKIIHTDDREMVTAAIQHSHDPSGDGLFNVEFRVILHDGTIRWLSTHSHTFFEGEANERRAVRTIGAVRDITVERQSHDALEQGKIYAERLIESASAIIVVLDSEGKVQVFNKAAEEITGYTRQEILRHNWFEILVPQNKYPEVWNIFRNATQEGIPKLFENPILTKEGVERIISWQNTELYENGTYSGSISYGTDITNRKQAEEAVRKSESRFRTLVQTIPDMIWLKDQDGVYLSCNTKFGRFLGAKEEDIVGKTDYDFVDSEQAECLRAQDREVIAAGKSCINEEWVTFSANGNRLLLETIKTPMYDSEGVLVGVLGIGRDITERRNNEEALQRYSFLMKEMGKAAKIGGWEFDTATGRGTWTEEVALIHEVEPTDATSVETGLSFYTEESRDLVTQAIENTTKSGEPYTLELEMITANGNHKWVKTIGYPVFENGKVVKLRGSFQDITKRKHNEIEREKLQAQLTQAQKMESVGRLAGGVAHDFNNMLGVILGYTELSLELTENDQTLHSSLQEIQMAALRSADLTRQLLAFARKQTVTPKVIDLNSTVESMLSMLRRLIGEDINLVWLPAKKTEMVKIDPSQIDQILANLCVNSRDAMKDTGKVTVETHNVEVSEVYQSQHPHFRAGKYVVLMVSDNGSGMSKETQNKLFEPFFTTKEQGKGTGLGLASVYGIVKQNNGYINVYSELGLGTTIKIYLPQHETYEEHLYAKKFAEDAARGNETILLVEDEPAILKMTARMLEQLGYKVLKTSIPTEAVDIARAHAGEIQLLITDVIMPEINGRALAKSILAIIPELKCLFMSGYTSNVIAHHGVLDKGVLFIQKPFSKHDLAAKIRIALYQNSD